MSEPITFPEWFEFERRRRKVKPGALRRFLADECAKRGVEVSERTLRAAAKGLHEPRLPLRRALADIAGLPLDAFAPLQGAA